MLIGVPNHIKQILTDLKAELDGNTIIVGDFNTLLSTMDKSPTEKSNRELMDLNYTFFFFFLATLLACRRSWARDQTLTTAATQAAVVTTPDT